MTWQFQMKFKDWCGNYVGPTTWNHNSSQKHKPTSKFQVASQMEVKTQKYHVGCMKCHVWLKIKFDLIQTYWIWYMFHMPNSKVKKSVSGLWTPPHLPTLRMTSKIKIHTCYKKESTQAMWRLHVARKNHRKYGWFVWDLIKIFGEICLHQDLHVSSSEHL